MQLPEPTISRAKVLNKTLASEVNYNRAELEANVKNNSTLNIEQEKIYRQVLADTRKEVGSPFFIDAPGGTGKTTF